jgi:amidohydrolase
MPTSSTRSSTGEPFHTLDAESEELRDVIVHVRRHLHAHPELGFEEHATSGFIREVLEAHGFTVEAPLAETGLYVDIEGSEPGPTIAYRADIDALPISDAKDVSYASSTADTAHLCGHDAHTAIAVGIALLLKRHRQEIRGRVRVFFQPAEEKTPSGAPEMIADGVLEDVQAVYAIHVDSSQPVGTFGLKSGALTASSDSFVAKVVGASTGHSARPYEVDDTVWIANQILNSLYQIVGRIQDTRSPAVLTICRFKGGEALNVVPREVEFGGTIRTITAEDRTLLTEQIKRTVRKFGEMYDVETSSKIRYGSPPVRNDKRLIDLAHQVISRELGPNAVHWIPQPSMGGEDFAHYLTHVPGALIRLGTSDGPDTSYPLHDANFDISEDALPIGVHLMTKLLIETLNSHVENKYLSPNR